jgi:hypothetical protein
MRSASRSSRCRLAVIGLFCALGLAAGGAVFAQDVREDGSAIIYTEVPIPTPNVETTPGSTLDRKMEYLTEGKVEDLAQYLGIIYNFLISIAGLVASVMLIIGGFQYVTSAGDAGKIGAAKTRMTNALMGLLLVLGAYTILKTINPALVVLKVPGGVSNVKSQLVTLPWCDEVADKTQVNPIWGEPQKCGSVGEFQNGKSRLACIYRSACPNFNGTEIPAALRDSKYNGELHSTCVQTLTTSAYVNDPFNSNTVLEFVDRDNTFNRLGVPPCWKEFHLTDTGCSDSQGRQWREKYGTWTNPQTGKVRSCPAEKGSTCDYNDMYAWSKRVVKEELGELPFGAPRPAEQLSGTIQIFARCMSCLEYGAVEKKRGPGAPDPVDGSVYLYQTPHEGRCAYWQSEANGGIGFGPTAWTKRKEAGQPLLSYCRWMPDEGGCAQADFECHEPISDNGCGAYDNIKPFYMFDTVKGGYVWWIYGGGKNGTLSSRPDALQNVCYSNPCGYNLPKGCQGEGGVVNGIRTAAAIVRDGISGIQACENK